MHVLIVTNYFAPEGGAAAVRLTRLAEGLHRRGHQVTVLTSLPNYPQGRIDEGHRGRFSMVTDREGVRVVQTWLLATASPSIKAKLLSQLSFMVTATVRGLALPKPDVLLVESQPMFAGFAGVVLASLKLRPYVLNVSDLWPEHLISVGVLTATHPVYRCARWLMDWSYRHAARIVVMSPRWAEGIAARLPAPTPIEMIYNGVDLAQLRPDPTLATKFRERWGLRGAKIVSFIGTLSTQYDLEVMLAVTARLVRRPETEVVFIGCGSQETTLQQALEEIPRVTWIPWVAQAEIPAAWNASTVTFFALRDQPLYRGTIPAKLYEALAAGVPIAAAIGGVGAEMITASGGGVAVACGDADAFAGALEAFLDNPEHRASASVAGRRYAERYFDATRIFDAYERTLLEVVGGRERSARKPT